MKVETVEEFLARGGQVEKFDYIPPVEVREHVKTNNSAPTIYDLGYGELLYGYRGVSTKKKDISEKLQKTNLPNDILERLKERLNVDKVK
jgi:hypothetical protein